MTPQCAREGDGAGKCLGVLVEGRSHGLTISEGEYQESAQACGSSSTMHMDV